MIRRHNNAMMRPLPAGVESVEHHVAHHPHRTTIIHSDQSSPPKFAITAADYVAGSDQVFRIATSGPYTEEEISSFREGGRDRDTLTEMASGAQAQTEARIRNASVGLIEEMALSGLRYVLDAAQAQSIAVPSRYTA